MAANNIDKNEYGVPGTEFLVDTDDDFEIEITDESTEHELENGDIEVIFGEMELETLIAPFEGNIAELLSDDNLQKLATKLVGEVEDDISSRKEWADVFVKGMEVLGLKYEERTEPWANACGAYSTVLSEAAMRFQAEAMSETFPPQGPVKTKIIGEVTPEREEAAERVRVDMNYEITEVMTEYRPEHERMLYNLGLGGSCFKKVYYDPAMGRQVSLHLPAEEVIVPYGASHIESAERVTHVMRKTPNDFLKLQAAGFYTAVDLGDPEPYTTDIEEKKAEESGYTLNEDGRYTFYEIHVDEVIPGFNDPFVSGATVPPTSELQDGEEEVIKEIARPYIVTIDTGTNEVLSIYRNWRPDDPNMLKRQHFVHYTYVPGFGFYGLGLIHIIGGYAKAGTSIIRQLVDAGTLANLPGGFKTRGFRGKGDDEPIGPGSWVDVDVPAGSIQDNIMPLPYGEPSQVLLMLLERITEEGRRLGAISDMNVGDMSANAPVGTTLAILERTLKPMAAVQARVHYAMKQEFKLLKGIIAEYAPEDYGYVPYRAEPRAKREDYALTDVIPVSDPNSTTMAQRVVQYQAVHQLSASAPQIYDLPFLHRQMITNLGVPNADKIVTTDDDAKPMDVVSENMAALVGKPIKAFIYQDHQAHMTAHQAFLQDPMIAESIGQNPMAQQIGAAMQAHIAEHLGFLYRSQMEEKMGVALPAPNEELPEEFEIRLSKLLAQAGTEITQGHQQEAAQKEAQQQAEDPVMQLKKQDSDTKVGELQRKIKKDADDKDTDDKKLMLDEKGMMIDAEIDITKVKQSAAQSDKQLEQSDKQNNRAARAAAATTVFNAQNAKNKTPPPKGDV